MHLLTIIHTHPPEKETCIGIPCAAMRFPYIKAETVELKQQQSPYFNIKLNITIESNTSIELTAWQLSLNLPLFTLASFKAVWLFCCGQRILLPYLTP